MRAAIAVLMIAAVAVIGGCLADFSKSLYGAYQVRAGESATVLGWNMSVANLRWNGGYVLVDVDAARSGAGAPQVKPDDGPLRPVRHLGASRGGDRSAQLRHRAGLTSTPLSDGWRAEATELTQAALGDPTVVTGNGYLLLGLQADAPAAEYLDDSARRGGPMMLLAAPTLPGPGLDPACATYGASVLILPDSSRDAVRVNASPCTQGEINAALPYATVSVVGTHAAVWVTRD